MCTMYERSRVDHQLGRLIIFARTVVATLRVLVLVLVPLEYRTARYNRIPVHNRTHTSTNNPLTLLYEYEYRTVQLLTICCCRSAAIPADDITHRPPPLPFQAATTRSSEPR